MQGWSLSDQVVADLKAFSAAFLLALQTEQDVVLHVQLTHLALAFLTADLVRKLSRRHCQAVLQILLLVKVLTQSEADVVNVQCLSGVSWVRLGKWHTGSLGSFSSRFRGDCTRGVAGSDALPLHVVCLHQLSPRPRRVWLVVQGADQT